MRCLLLSLFHIFSPSSIHLLFSVRSVHFHPNHIRSLSRIIWRIQRILQASLHIIIMHHPLPSFNRGIVLLSKIVSPLLDHYSICSLSTVIFLSLLTLSLFPNILVAPFHIINLPHPVHTSYLSRHTPLNSTHLPLSRLSSPSYSLSSTSKLIISSIVLLIPMLQKCNKNYSYLLPIHIIYPSIFYIIYLQSKNHIILDIPNPHSIPPNILINN